METTKKRIGKDVYILCKITFNGGEPFTADDQKYIQVELKDRHGNTYLLPSKVTEDGLLANFQGERHKLLGAYMMTVWYKRGYDGTTCADLPNLFELVETTLDDTGEDMSVFENETIVTSISIEYIKGEFLKVIAKCEDATEKANEATQNTNEATEKAKTATTNANNAARNAEGASNIATAAADKANTASEGAEKVNAQLNGNVVTITNRAGQSKSVDLGDNVKLANITSFKTKYFIEDGKTILYMNNLISAATAYYDHYDLLSGARRYRIDLMQKRYGELTSSKKTTTSTFTIMAASDSQYKWYRYVGQVVTDKDNIVQSLTDDDGESVSDIELITKSNWGTIIKSLFNPITDIADNLTTDDATKILSAKQGKVLDEKMKQVTTNLSKAIDDTNDAIDAFKDEMLNEENGTLVQMGARIEENTFAIEDQGQKLSELEEEVGNIEGASAEEMRMYLPMGDIEKMPTRCGQPIELYGEGTPQEAIVPYNWNQLDIETGDGYMWNGLPAFEGQRYINVNATSRALYIGVKISLKKDNVNQYTLKWFNV